MTAPKTQPRPVPTEFDAPGLAAVLVQHLPQIWSSGGVECSCGAWKRMRSGDDWHRATHEFRGDAIRAHANHQAGMLIAAMAGGAS